MQSLKLQSSFSSLNSATACINKLPALLASKGYPVASVDSSWFTDTSANILLYLGTKYNWVKLKPVSIEKEPWMKVVILKRIFWINLLILPSYSYFNKGCSIIMKRRLPFCIGFSWIRFELRICQDRCIAEIR